MNLESEWNQSEFGIRAELESERIGIRGNKRKIDERQSLRYMIN